MISFFRRKAKAFLVYSIEYNIGLSGQSNSEILDVYKFKRIKERLLNERAIKQKQIILPGTVDNLDLQRVHSPKYIKQIQDPIFVNNALKLNVNDPWDNSLLEYFKIVTAGTVTATIKAIESKRPVFNLGGGFHHAKYQQAEGFCLINDIAVAIEKARAEKSIKKVLIVDLDYHQGNGNLDIYKDDPDVYTFSIHADTWLEQKAIANRDIQIKSNITKKEYLQLIKANLKEIEKEFQADLIFYVAGSDPYKHDALADMQIGRKAMLKRNLSILKFAWKRRIPLVVVAGGGYGPKSWKIYYDFISHALKGTYV